MKMNENLFLEDTFTVDYEGGPYTPYTRPCPTGDEGAAVEINGDENIVAILGLCDPRAALRTKLVFIKFWTRAWSAIDAFLSHKHAPTSTNHQPPTAGEC
jgi:hypothetical protein